MSQKAFVCGIPSGCDNWKMILGNTVFATNAVDLSDAVALILTLLSTGLVNNHFCISAPDNFFSNQYRTGQI